MKVLFFLTVLIVGVYYKLFFLGKIPFPGDLLVGSYSPWLDYYKIPVQNPLISDVFSQFFLWKYLAVESIKNWQWPLWNPYSFTGTPLLATYHSATLYPLNILLFLPKYFGWGLYIFSQTLIASITSFLFLSLLTRNLFARLTGAIIFAFGGLMTTWLELGTAVHAMAWLPLGLYAVKRFSDTFKLRFALLLIISLFLLTLAGNAQITIYAYLIIISYGIYLNLQDKFHPKVILFLLFATSLTTLLSAIQILPSLDLLQKSIRQTESYSAQSNFGLLNIKDSFKFFIADYFGNDVTRNYWGNLNYPETSGFLGTLTLPLLIYAMFRVRGKDASFFFVLLGVSLILTFDNPISSNIYQTKIPLLTSSYASRMLFVTLLSGSVLVALAIDHLQKYKDINFFQKNILWSASAIAGIITGTLAVYRIASAIFEQAPNEIIRKSYLSYNDYALANFLVASKNSLVPLSILCILFILLLINKFFAKNKINILLAAVFILLFLDLGRYFLKFNPFVSQNLIFPQVPALQFLQTQPGMFRVGREHAEVFPPNTWIAYRIQSIEGYDPLYLNSFAKFMHFLNGGDIRSGSSSRYAELSQKYDSFYIDSANVKYFIGIGRDRNGIIPGDLINYRFNEAGYKRVFQDGSSVILENPNVLERVFFSSYIITLPQAKIEDLIMSDKTFDPRKVTALSQDLNITSVSATGSATITYYSPNTVRVKTENNLDGVLVLTDQYEEGWKAKIDNKETPISPANLIFKAVKVPAGSHEVTFNYYPKSFNVGLKTSAVTFLLLVFGTGAALKLRRF